jgi:hypothetical protein
MKHVFGMAKRCLSLNGANAQKVELDYLRLVYAVKELRRESHEAKGYLLVMTPAIAKRTERWLAKYNAGDAVEVIVPELTEEMKSIIKIEIINNIDGMIAGTIGEDVAGRADATPGCLIGERLLSEWIEQHETGISRQNNEKLFPLRIRWDYYGTDIVSQISNSEGA